MTLYAGVDVGGSTVRVIIIDENLETAGYLEYAYTANPSIVGFERAALTIGMAIQQVMNQANLNPDDITAVGIGVSGASNTRSRDWLINTVLAVLPDVQVIPSSDQEIALVGATGKREGVLILAGTGSVVFGVNPAGKMARVGGWGYLLGDEGSGYWLGARGLAAVLGASEGHGKPTLLTERLLSHIGLTHPEAIINWLYGITDGRNQTVARLAPLVMDTASEGDEVALALVDAGVEALYDQYQTVITRLGMSTPPQISFSGGLLESPTLVRDKLMIRLNLTEPPARLYRPVMGAALLAKLTCKK